jgi:hypothetical protein
MASDTMKAAVGFAKILVALAVGYAIAYIWNDNRPGDDFYMPYLAGLVTAVMVFFLLSRLNKGGPD